MAKGSKRRSWFSASFVTPSRNRLAQIQSRTRSLLESEDLKLHSYPFVSQLLTIHHLRQVDISHYFHFRLKLCASLFLPN